MRLTSEEEDVLIELGFTIEYDLSEEITTDMVTRMIEPTRTKLRCVFKGSTIVIRQIIRYNASPAKIEDLCNLQN